MRIHLKTTANTSVVPFNYQQKLVGVLHRWLGAYNKEHGAISFYSFSWLLHGKWQKDGLDFPEGATWQISFIETENIKQIIRLIRQDASMFCGMSVVNIIIEEEPDLSERNLFHCASPILIKRKEGECERHYTYNDAVSADLLKETLQTKMRKAGLPEDETLEIYFDTSCPKKKTKLIHYRNIGNKTNLCPVIIKGKPETKAFAWHVGIGSSTGIGFGAIY